MDDIPSYPVAKSINLFFFSIFCAREVSPSVKLDWVDTVLLRRWASLLSRAAMIHLVLSSYRSPHEPSTSKNAIRPRLQNNTPTDAVEGSGDEVLRLVHDVWNMILHYSEV
jgi:hypothetical protein